MTVLALRLNCPPFLHPGLCNDALSVWEHQSAFILPELLGCLAQHGRRAVGDELLSPPQQHLRTPTRQTRDGGRKEERARDQHEELVQCHSRWTTTMRARRRTYCWVKQTQEPITDGIVLIHGIKTRTKSPNPSHTASFLSATSHYSEVPSSSADSRGSHAFEWLSNRLSTSFSMICIS